jgi:adenosylhomocysteine nucleosidase
MSCQELIATMAERGYWNSPGGQTPSAKLYLALLRELQKKGAQAWFRAASKARRSRKQITPSRDRVSSTASVKLSSELAFRLSSNSSTEMIMRMGIMGAMTEEIAAIEKEMGAETATELGMRRYFQGILWGTPSVLVFSRWGKVAAATTATCLISHFNVDAIVFTGVAGGTDPSLSVGDIVVATSLFQHDMNATPLFPRGEIPLLGVTSIETNEQLRNRSTEAASRFLLEDLRLQVPVDILEEFRISNPKVIQGDVASGDKFFADKDDIHRLKRDWPSVACVEMEGAAVAQVCYEYKVPFVIIRTISDSADDSAHIEFPKFIQQVASVYSHGILQRLLTVDRN